MKKNRIIIALFTALAATSCYEDKSTLPDNPIDGVTLNATEEEKTIRVGYKEQIDIVPNITRNGKSDDSGLTYEWAINLFPGWSKTEYEVVGTEKELHTVLDNEVNSDSYYLRLLVTDTMHDDLQYSFLYQVYVQPSLLDGLLICDTKDEQNSDFNLVMNNKLTSFYNKEEKVFRNILSEKNEIYSGLVKFMAPASADYYPGTNFMWTIDENNQLVGYNTENYTMSDMDKCFVYKPESVYSVMRAGQYICAATDMGFYAVIYTNFTSSYFGWINASLSNYPIDNNVYAAFSGNGSYALAAWFCDEADAFISGDMIFNNAQAAPFNNTTYDLSNKRAIAGGMSVDEVTPTFLLKDEVTGEYTIYTLSRQKDAEGEYDADWNWIETAPGADSSIKNAYTIPAEGKTLLDKAVAYSFAALESILYVATADGVYTINFAGATATVNSVAQFTASGEEITGMKLYQQGMYITEHDSRYNAEEPDKGGWEETAWNNRAVIVTTQKGSEGVVYVVPMTQLGTGNLDATDALRYDGFGRILAVSTTVY
ncbi:MAG: hypothetical protein IJ494_07745 [Bacteroides sp.]|nr:hypothetical protein [Bacteroides sp.]